MTNVTCEYCGTSYALNDMTLVPSMLKCTQCGASIKVYQPHAKLFDNMGLDGYAPVTSGSSYSSYGIWKEMVLRGLNCCT